MFLGDVPEPDVPLVTRALAGVPAPGPITLRLAGGGRFGPVVWAGLAGDLELLEALREDVRSALAGSGFPVDERPFRPHLTISYRYDRRVATALDGYAGPLWTVDGLALVSSADGEYTRLWEQPACR